MTGTLAHARRALASLALFGGLLPSLFSQNPVVPEDLWTLPQAAQPLLSPDRQVAVYQLRQADENRNRVQSVLLGVDLESLKRSPLTFNASDVRWSPDGRFLSFRGSYGDAHGLYRAELVMEEEGMRLDPPLQLVTFPPYPSVADDATTRLHQWSPDGGQIAFIAPDLETCATASSPAAPVIWDKVPIDPFGEGASDCPSRLYLMASRGGEKPLALSPPGYRPSTLAWSPEGEELAFIGTDPEGSTGRPGLWVVQPSNGAVRAVAADLTLTGPLHWSPDGAYLTAVAPGPGGGETLVRLSARTGERTDLAEAETGFEDIGIDPAGSWVYYNTVVDGRHCVMRTEAGGEPEEVICREGRAGAFDLSGEEILFDYQEPSEPSNLFRADADGMFKEQITFHGRRWRREKNLAEVEAFRLPDEEGTLFVATPPDHDPAIPIPVVHYLPDPEEKWEGYAFHFLRQVLVGQGYAVLYAASGRPKSGTLETEAALLEREAGFQRKALTLALERYPFLDPDRLLLWGSAQGAFLGVHLLAREGNYRAAAFRALPANLLADPGILSSGQAPGTFQALWERSPLAMADGIRAPTLLLHGAEESRAPPGQAKAFFAALQAKGTPSRLVLYPGEGERPWAPASKVHAYRQLIDWYAERLDKAP